jgi:hypothetical protein
MNREIVVELMAASIFAHWSFGAPVKWVVLGNSEMQDKARSYARVALAALCQRLPGLEVAIDGNASIVPNAITDDMCRELNSWACCAAEIEKGYEAMLEASPFKKAAP